MARSLIKNILLVVAVAAIATSVACVRSADEGGRVRDDLPLQRLRDGDLLFRCGVGTQSRVVTGLDTAGGEYSHVGIAFNDGGKWRVVHAVPGESADGVDRVKIDAVDTFFMTSRAVHGAAMRFKCDDATARRAAIRARRLAQQQVPFDHRYNWTDTTSLYCTELVQLAYQSVGIDLAVGRHATINLPVYRGTIVFPSHIAGNDSLSTIFAF